ncbi:MAG: chalcone isomerase family protein [Proteobacteria bacterium]|nr:chalcone isomerase family protein [Pseudomonadota bacterium]
MKKTHYLLPTMLVILLAWSAPALAGQKAGITMPDTIKVAGKTLVLNGLGLREATIFNVDVYVAGLYVESKSKNGDAIAASRGVKRMHLKFKRDVDQDDMAEAWNTGFKKVAKKDWNALKDRVATLRKWMEDIHKGKSLILTYVPDKGVKVEINGKVKGVIAGDDFARALFSIWIGRNSPYGSMRSGLLGAK